MALNDTQVKNAKPKDRPYKLSDEKGLTLLQPSGAKWWRLRYYVDGREKMLSLGVYPDVSLKKARDRREEARSMVADGIYPSQQRQEEKAADVNTFEEVAREWFAKHKVNWIEGHASKVLARLEDDVFPYIGRSAVAKLKPAEVLSVLRRVENRGAVETAHCIHQSCGAVMRYAVATGRAERDVTQDLHGALPPAQVQHRASIIDPEEIDALLRAIDGYGGLPVVLVPSPSQTPLS